VVDSDCLPAQVVNATSFVARLKPSGSTDKLFFGVTIYIDGQYVLEDEFSTYVITQVFKGNSLLVGETIPVMWATDTGMRANLPDYIAGNGDFLAFMGLRESCSFSDDELESGIYVMSECNFYNMPWSDLSLEEKATLGESTVDDNMDDVDWQAGLEAGLEALYLVLECML